MKGYSLHIGVNKVDETHYPGVATLNAAVNDAIWWQKYAEGLGYDVLSLYDEHATLPAVKNLLNDYAQKMVAGDILLLTYSGHGGEIPNQKSDATDLEKMDQTWCLYDEQLLDDELYECFEEFAEGTRILVVADSCHSGTVTRAVGLDLTKELEEGMSRARKSRGFESRQLPEEVQRAVMAGAFDTCYRPKLERYEDKPKRAGVKASVKLLAACQDHQVTYDGAEYGIFTEALRRILLSDQSRKRGEELIAAVRKQYSYPRPNFFEYGGIIRSFDEGVPFEINIENAGLTEGYRDPKLTDSRSFTEPDDPESGDIGRNAVVVLELEDGDMLADAAGGAEIKILEDKWSDNSRKLTLELSDIPYQNGWGAAHALQTQLEKRGVAVSVEPVLHFNADIRHSAARASDGSTEYIPEWPPAGANPRVNIGWHLDDDHSQLASASGRVWQNPEARVRVAHVDTGYIQGHIGLPVNLEVSKARSFVSGEVKEQAIDPPGGQDGHGMGTIGILAGNKVPAGATFNEFEGYIGGVPFAHVVPIRISESVIIWNSDNFCEGIEYALEQGCEVVTMSMAGKPNPRMAKVVNKAYEDGVVIVSAASNCWYKGPMTVAPKCVIWPAAFERVIAATGALYDHKPYDKDFLLSARLSFTAYMQGCWGPASRMKKALAAYTPNTPWASVGNIFSRSGGGTSSATPQVAAAAALWIAHHRKDMEAAGFYEPGNKWKIVEAVRYALYTSAAKEEVFADWKKYFGNGILRANRALDIGVRDLGPLSKSAKAESSFGGFFQIAGSFFKNRRLFRDPAAAKPPGEALSLELLQLLQTDPAFFELFSTLDLEDGRELERLFSDANFIEKVQSSPYASEFLKQAVAN